MSNPPLKREEILEIFKESFRTNHGSDYFECPCGIIYFTKDYFEEDEEPTLEELRKFQKFKKNYREVDHISLYGCFGREYVMECDCINENNRIKSAIDLVHNSWEQWMEFLLTVHKEEKDFYDSRNEKILRLLGKK